MDPEREVTETLRASEAMSARPGAGSRSGGGGEVDPKLVVKGNTDTHVFGRRESCRWTLVSPGFHVAFCLVSFLMMLSLLASHCFIRGALCFVAVIPLRGIAP